jgi:two-component system invasion response regulator UvrY
MMSEIKIAVVDDHKLFRDGVISALKKYKSFTPVLEADNGRDFIDKLTNCNKDNFPDVVLLDIQMPVMDGIATVDWLKQNLPALKIVMLSMHNDETMVTSLFKRGIHAYLTKNSDSKNISDAILAVTENDFFYSPFMAEKLHQSLINGTWNANKKEGSDKALWNSLSDREKIFISLACSELTYAEIAKKMELSPKTIDGYRDSLFEKLHVKTRVGLVMAAIKNLMVTIL